MINPQEEPLIRLTDVPSQVKWLPKRNGRPPTVRTVYRWAKVGWRGVKLETLQSPDALCTSNLALVRFHERLSMPPSGKAQTPSQRTGARRRAADILDAAGIK